MSITPIEEKDSKSVLQRIQGGLSKYFVTARSYTFEETNEYLGITNVADDKSNISYVLYAQYVNQSKTKNPIVGVGVNYQGEEISRRVYIKVVNPKHATMLEMFALCSYADDTGLYKGENTSSFHQLKGYVHNASMHGMCEKITGYQDFCNKKVDWDKIINKVKDIYLRDEVFDQYRECLKLMELFDYFYEKLECVTL